MNELTLDTGGDTTVITFPFHIGDEMLYAVEEDGDVRLIRYEARGFAYMDGKMYAIDADGCLNEYMTPCCIPRNKI